MLKNSKGKTRKPDNPYETIKDGGWTWKVLKHYQTTESELQNPTARVFCHVTSPYCPEGEYGDTYIRDIPGLSEYLEKELQVIKTTAN